MNPNPLLEPGALFAGALFQDLVESQALLSLPLGTRLGAFLSGREIGRGGMGVVYRGERADGQFEQQVALKLLAEDGKGLGADLFRRERQILAELKHPHIARLLDGGRTSEGLLWFAMELIEGERIDAHCRNAGLALDQRLALFLSVTEAVQFAHSRMLIHRDIKPANVLVDSDGRPKLLDFGIAALAGDSAAARAYSPGWASPEQLAGAAVGTASDQFQLALLLLAMLRSGSIASTRGSHTAASAGQPEGAGQALPPVAIDERDWLPMPAVRRIELNAVFARACAPDPSLRYGSVGEFAREIECMLERRPVEAKRGNLPYTLGCIVRRQPGTVVSSALVVVAFLALILASNWRIAQERDLARAEASRAQVAEADARSQVARVRAVSEFVNTDVLGAANPILRPATSPPMTVADALSNAEAAVERRFADAPDLAVSVYATLGTVYGEFGWLDKSIAVFDRAIALQDRVGPDSRELLLARAERGLHLTEKQLYPDALAALEPLVSDAERVLGKDHEQTLDWSFWLLDARSRQGADAAILPDYAALAERAERALGSPNYVTGMSWLRIARQPRAKGLIGTTPVESERAWRMLTATRGADHPSTLQAQVDYAHALCNQDRINECLRLIRESVDLFVARYGPDQLDAMNYKNDLGYALSRAGKLIEAEAAYTEVAELRERNLGPLAPQAMTAYANLANARLRLGRAAPALDAAERAVSIVRATPAMAVALRVQGMRVYIEALIASQRLSEAQSELAQVLKIASEVPETDVRRIVLGATQARLWFAQDLPAEAGPELLRCIAALRLQLPDEHPLLVPLLEFAREQGVSAQP